MTCDYAKVYRVTALPALADQELNAWYLVSGLTGIMEIYVKGNDQNTAPRKISAVASAVGSNTQVQFNNGGLFGASADFTFDDAANRLFVNGNFRLPVTSGSGAGVIEVGTARFLHSYGSDNMFLGLGAGNFTLTGIRNVAIGSFSGDALTSGQRNMLIGYNSGSALTTGSSNMAIGAFAMVSATTGSNNVMIGESAGFSMNSSNNVGIGTSALVTLSSGNNNTAIGSQAGSNLTTGLQNLLLGRQAGNGLVSGNYNVVIGSVTGLAADLSNTIVIGDGQGNERLRMDANRAAFTVSPKSPEKTVLQANSAYAASAGAGSSIFVTNATGGPILAISDGTNWRRVTDNTIIN